MNCSVAVPGDGLLAFRRSLFSANEARCWPLALQRGYQPITRHTTLLLFMPYLYLAIAILAEVIATSSLKATNGFTRWMPSLIVALGYGVAFYFLSLTLRTMSVGIAYAIWCGAGIVLVTLISWLVLGQKLDAPAIGGMALIIAGVVVINTFSKSVSP